MAPGSSQKGTGKKNAALAKQSRNSTPAPASSLPPEEFYDPDYLNTRVILFPNLTYEDVVDQGASNATVPDSKTVDAMLEKLKHLTNVMEKRSTFYDRGMRYLADERKKRPDDFDRMHVDGDEGKKPKSKRKKGGDDVGNGKTASSHPHTPTNQPRRYRNANHHRAPNRSVIASQRFKTQTFARRLRKLVAVPECPCVPRRNGRRRQDQEGKEGGR